MSLELNKKKNNNSLAMALLKGRGSYLCRHRLGFAESDKGIEYMIASESAALEGMGFQLLRDVLPERLA